MNVQVWKSQHPTSGIFLFIVPFQYEVHNPNSMTALDSECKVEACFAPDFGTLFPHDCVSLYFHSTISDCFAPPMEQVTSTLTLPNTPMAWYTQTPWDTCYAVLLAASGVPEVATRLQDNGINYPSGLLCISKTSRRNPLIDDPSAVDRKKTIGC